MVIDARGNALTVECKSILLESKEAIFCTVGTKKSVVSNFVVKNTSPEVWRKMFFIYLSGEKSGFCIKTVVLFLRDQQKFCVQMQIY